MKNKLSILFLFFTIYLNAQILPTSRSTDWTLAGLRNATLPTNVILFTGDNSGGTDVSALLQANINSAPANSIIQLKAGTYKVLDEIVLESNITLRGKGAGVTFVEFDLSGADTSCFIATGSEPGTEYSLTALASKEDIIIQVTGTALMVGDYVRFIQDDQDLVNDSWAERRTGQISQVTAVTSTSITLASPIAINSASIWIIGFGVEYGWPTGDSGESRVPR